MNRFKAWLARTLGNRYAVVVSTVDRAVTAFGIIFATKLIGGNAFSVDSLAHWSYWQTAIAAGIAAAISVIKSVVLIGTTGVPALLSVVSPTLRARRNGGRRVDHHVPMRPLDKTKTRRA